MSYTFTEVTRSGRGARWQDGSPRMCTRCGFEQAPRRRQAVLTALLVYVGSKFRTPVGYCAQHVPEALQ